MTHSYKSLVAIATALIFLTLSSALGQEKDRGKPKPPPANVMLSSSSSEGREFWLAVPENDGEYTNGNLARVYIFVASRRPTEVRVFYKQTGATVVKKIDEPLGIVEFSSPLGDLTNGAELRESEIVTNKGIQVTADEPISVYFISDGPASSDGYLALPTKVWGNRYIHCGYWDLLEGGRNLGGGFGIVAAEDDTKIVIQLKGVDQSAGQNPLARTGKGRKIGDVISISLNAGQTYMVKGNGETKGIHDLTGSEIRSTKPVGVVSFQNRTGIPHIAGFNNRDVLMEFMPPVPTWGTRYVGIPFRRGSSTQGDLIRIVASERDTKYTIKWFDLVTDEETASIPGVLANAGDWDYYNEGPNLTTIAVNGAFIVEADKPIHVMQYSFSGQFDGQFAFDPCMVNVTTQDQFVRGGTIFQTPNFTFNDNNINVIAVGNTDDPQDHKERIESLFLDGQKVATINSSIVGKNIPGTQLYWARIGGLAAGQHYIESVNNRTTFAAYGYGFANVISYCWPSAQAYYDISITDTLEPELIIDDECTLFNIRATEIRNRASDCDDCPEQEDTGVAEVEIIDSLSKNFALTYITGGAAPDAVPNANKEKLTPYDFQLEVIDPTQDAIVVYYVLDKRGNVVVDTLTYTADLVEMDPDFIDFGNVRVGRSIELTAELVNPTSKEVTVTRIELRDNSVFKLIEGNAPPEYILGPSSTATLRFTYTPTDAQLDNFPDEVPSIDDIIKDTDEVLAETSCGEFVIGTLEGTPVAPRIAVTDFDAGTIRIGDQQCNNTLFNNIRGIEIRNTGTDAFTITGADVPNPSEFTLSNPANPEFPITIPPFVDDVVELREICYSPTDAGSDIIQVPLVFAPEDVGTTGDNISEWRGASTFSDISLSGVNFDQERVLMINIAGTAVTPRGNGRSDLPVGAILRNIGEQPLTITAVNVANPGDFTVQGQFTYAGTNYNLPFSGSFQLQANDEITIPVTFQPQAVGTQTDDIVVTYEDQGQENTITAALNGSSMLPVAGGTGYDYPTVYTVGDGWQADANNGVVTITNDASANEPLHVYNVAFRGEAGGEVDVDGNTTPDFRWTAGFNRQDLVINPGDQVQIPFEYNAETDGRLRAEVDICHNGTQGPDTTFYNDCDVNNPNIVTVEVSGESEPAPIPGRLSAEGDDLGSIIACETVTGNITISNGVTELDGSTTRPVNVTLTMNDPNGVFTFVGPNPTTLSYTATAPTNQVPVLFTPPANANLAYGATVNMVVDGGFDGDTTVNLNAEAFTRAVNLGVGIINGKSRDLRPGEDFSLALTIEGDVAEARITEMEITVRYEKGMGVAFRGQDQDITSNGGIVTEFGNWEVRQPMETREETINDVVYTVQTFTVGAIVNRELEPGAIVARLDFRQYLADVLNGGFTVDARITNSAYNDANACIALTTGSADITQDEFCLRDSRALTRSQSPTSLIGNVPNPVKGSTRIQYSVAVETHTTIKLYNAAGNVVRVLVDEVKSAGQHEVEVSTEVLPSGQYYYTMKTGLYNNKKPMLIIK